MAPITDLILTWTHIGQALVGSIGALALAKVKLVCITLIGNADIDRADPGQPIASSTADAARFAEKVAPCQVDVAELSIEDARFNVVDENPEDLVALEQASGQDFNLSPHALGGTSVRIDLVVEDPDAAARRAIAAGGRELFPVADQPYGWRQGRVIDPFGHHWLIGKPLS